MWPRLDRVLLDSGATAIVLKKPPSSASTSVVEDGAAAAPTDSHGHTNGMGDSDVSGDTIPVEVRHVTSSERRIERIFCDVPVRSILRKIPVVVGERVFFRHADALQHADAASDPTTKKSSSPSSQEEEDVAREPPNWFSVLRALGCEERELEVCGLTSLLESGLCL